eukprot:Partr_v1_DN25635_c0_g1_i2_m4543 putative SEC22 vesicle trafficking protein homolog
MFLFTLVARIVDGLPLVSSLDPFHAESESQEFKRLAKLLARKFNPLSRSDLPERASVLAPVNPRGSVSLANEDYTLHYSVHSGVVFIVLAERSFSRLLCFSYLLDLQQSFDEKFKRSDIEVASRPYAFMKFEPVLERSMRKHLRANSLSAAVMNSVNQLLISTPVLAFESVFADVDMAPSSSAPALRNPSYAQLRPVAGVSLMHFLFHSDTPFIAFTISCWLYIATWNLTHDIWFGLRTLFINPSSEIAFELVSPKLHAQKCALALDTPIAFVYGLAGFWLVFQCIRYFVPVRLSSNPLLEGIFCPSPLFEWKLLVFLHVMFTHVFLYQVSSIRQSSGIDYFEYRWPAINTDGFLLNSDGDFTLMADSEGYHLEILPYYLYVGVFWLWMMVRLVVPASSKRSSTISDFKRL